MRAKRNKLIKIGLIGILTVCLASVIMIGVLFLYAKVNVDYTRDEMLFNSKQFSGASRLYYFDDEGKPCEYCIISPSDNKRLWYSYSEISDLIKNAFISAEDRGFFSHGGVDFKRTAYAAFNYIFKLRPEFGGSTITQQVVKNISGDNEHSAARKLNEMLRAVHIEDIYSKDEIFEVYLNIVPMGNGISGVGLASQYYFGKEPSMLTIDEAAVLVGITNAPGLYDPYTNYKACIEKRNRVLYAMRDNGVIGDGEYESLTKKETVFKKQENDVYSIDSWFCETVVSDVSRDIAVKMNISENTARILLLNGGYSVYTTVEPEIQEALEEYFNEKENFPSEVNSGLDFSMIITDSESGYVVAVAGSVGKKNANRISNGVTLPCTPGSTLKPLALYAPYIDSGLGCWSTVFDDVPYSFIKHQNGEYIDYPKNSPQRYDGLITLADALRLSKNSVAARIYNELGQDKIFNHLSRNFGFKLCERKKTEGGILTDRALAPLALGQLTYGVSLRELTGAYSSFIGGGVYREPITYTRVTDSRGNVILEKDQIKKRVTSRDTAEIMNMLLSGVVESGTASSITLDELYDTAGKTGTSGGDKDRLFIGYTPYYVAGIRCGYNSDRAIGKTGKSHLKIWDEVMRAIHEVSLPYGDALKVFSDDGLKYLPFCKDSGELFSDNCLYDQRGSRLEYGYFSDKKHPHFCCNVHVLCIDNEADVSDGLVSLLKIKKREFPTEISVSDSEYVYNEENTRYTRIDNKNLYADFFQEKDRIDHFKEKKYRKRNIIN